MTPQLQQAIKLLQMTNLDICNFCRSRRWKTRSSKSRTVLTTLRQPILRQPPRRRPRQRQSLRHQPRGLDRDMKEGGALADDPTAHADLENRFGSEGLDYGHAQRGKHADLDWDASQPCRTGT